MLFALGVTFVSVNAFACSSGQITYVDNGTTVCVEDKFQITTVPGTKSIGFTFYAAGTYYVDCNINDTSDVVKRAVVADTTTAMNTGQTITCNYDAAGEYTIGFGGTAENYIQSELKGSEWLKAGSNNCSTWGVFKFTSGSAAKVKHIYGQLGRIFPTKSGKPQPTFNGTFWGATNLTNIPGDLLQGVSGQPGVCMFSSMFYNTGITNIPLGLFSGISGTAEGLFASTFVNAKITSIDPGIFRNIQGPARDGMFSNTFMDTDELQYLPENLFGGITKDPNITSVGCFKDVFRDSGLKKLPNTMFSDYNNLPDCATFKNLFALSGDISGYVPYSLFENVNSLYSSDAEYDAKANNCSVQYDNSTGPYNSIFVNVDNLSLKTANCPQDMYKVTTHFDQDMINGSYYTPKLVCSDCPPGQISSGGTSCQTASVTCSAGQYLSSSRTSCETCPTAYPTSQSGATQKTDCYATVTYVFNNGEANLSEKYYYSNYAPSGYTPSLPTPNRSDYVFVGWNDENSNRINKGSTLSGNHTLTAQWSQIKCAQDYYLNSAGTGCLSCSTQTNGVYPNSIYDSKSKTSCFATVIFHPNNGTDNIKRNYYYSDSTSQGYTVDTSAPTTVPDNAIFKGWYTSGGTKATNTTSFQGNQDLYAQWFTSSYTISFDANGGDGGQTANVTAIYGQSMPAISTTPPTRETEYFVYEFGGWYDTADSTGGTQYYTAAGASARAWDKTENTTLYARWADGVYKIALLSNDGTQTYQNLFLANGEGWFYDSQKQSPAESALVPTRDGYTFIGYSLYQDQDITSTTNIGQKIDSQGNFLTIWNIGTPFYAFWAKNCVQPDHGTCSMVVTDAPNSMGTGYVTYSASCEEGYTLSGGNTATPTCTPNSITVNWNENGGDAVGNTICDYGGNLKLPSSVNRSGYTLSGWKAANDIIYEPGTTISGGCTDTYTGVKSGTSTIIQAQWCQSCNAASNANCSLVTSATGTMCTYNTSCKDGYTNIQNNGSYNPSCSAASYEVIFDKNADDAIAGTESATVVYNASMPSITKPTRTGYTFSGFYDTSDSTGGTQYYNSSGTPVRNWDKTSGATLYARWVSKTYTITLKKDNNATIQIIEVYGDKWTDSHGNTITSVPYNSQYGNSQRVFLGYFNTNSASGGTKYIDANLVLPSTTTFTSDMTLYGRDQDCTCSGGTNSSCYVTTNNDSTNFCKYVYTCKGNYNYNGSRSGTLDGDLGVANLQAPDCLDPNTYTITLDDATNGGSGGSGSIRETYGVNWTDLNWNPITSVAVPTKENYVFTGYYDAASGTATKYVDSNADLPSATTFSRNTT